MSKFKRNKTETFQLWGWGLFVLSAVFFIAASVRIRDMLSLLGGLFFLIACIVFIVPMVSSRDLDGH